MKKILTILLTVFIAGLANPAFARVEIDITQGNVDPMPIAVPDFLGAAAETTGLGRDITGVIMNDLDRSGLFQVIDQRAYIEKPDSVNVRPRFADWRIINAQVLVVGEVEELPDGRIQVATRVWDVYSDEQLAAVAFKTPADNWRRAAHKVSDFVYKALTGEEGYFDTRVVFVHETGPKENKTKRLMIMDQDGANPIPLTDGLGYQVLTPRFSPTQQQITYMALFDNRPGQVYLFNIETGEQEQLGTFRGMTFAPRFSPDGRQVIMSMERNGNSDVFKMDLSTRQLTRLTSNVAIDTSPTMSPDGRRIAFTSDRGGSQQIYVMNADGSDQKRITFGQGQYQTPVWSPRGDLIAFTRSYQGRFYIGVIRPDGSGERLLTESFLEEGPTWSPNGRVLMFYRQTPTRRDGSGGDTSLWSVDLTGRNLRRVRTPGDASDPAWSPLLP
ncbi:Tol-Pal system beta propeller repeat protein TolB [Hyphococcus flavus]|uniref:Tol-Pal system protein TolB n=1 Tax=Hyphococcus flavus TaxID=1866326 RepID=A0AAE9ZGL4_9PROT|nr:Tol-Pal system beta propeller repeat protein TolB [Hyphococcus flavus]WDI32387.1 Tol-Pal system beta propeller repeat protein TolB [Hyphococcus flavus]